MRWAVGRAGRRLHGARTAGAGGAGRGALDGGAESRSCASFFALFGLLVTDQALTRALRGRDRLLIDDARRVGLHRGQAPTEESVSFGGDPIPWRARGLGRSCQVLYQPIWSSPRPCGIRCRAPGARAEVSFDDWRRGSTAAGRSTSERTSNARRRLESKHAGTAPPRPPTAVYDDRSFRRTSDHPTRCPGSWFSAADSVRVALGGPPPLVAPSPRRRLGPAACTESWLRRGVATGAAARLPRSATATSSDVASSTWRLDVVPS